MTHIHHESVSSLNPPDYCVILSIAKNLKTYTLCIQILHYVQNDIYFWYRYLIMRKR